MNLTLFKRAQQVFNAVVDLPPPQRVGPLEAACGDDAELRALVQELLDEDDNENSGLQNWLARAVEPEPEPPLIQPGDTFGKYIVEHRLGAGGAAEVWAVRHQLLGNSHALKILRQTSATLQRRLMKEGVAQARLRHPNIVPVWDVLTVHGTSALLMPLIEGPSLDKLMRQHRLLPDQAITLFSGIVQGVQHAHRQQLVHRDLKPSNILLEIKNTQVVPRVTDFGLVKILDGAMTQHTHSGMFLGTPAYASPEQLQDTASVGAASDMFSLGVMLVEMLTGQRPFAGTTLQAVISAQEKPPDLSGLEGTLRDLAEALLRSDPARRPRCEAVLEQLAQIATIDRTLDQELFQIVARLRPAAPTPSLPSPNQRSERKTPPPSNHNLPTQRDRFLGREAELEKLTALITTGSRLITLTGTGGVGKTRLALEYGTSIRDDWPGGVWFCDLTEARDRSGVLATVAGALNVPLGRSPMEALGIVIAQKGRTLFIFDNLEQVLEAVTPALDFWLDAAPQVTFIATSRAPLRLRGEQLLIVEPLEETAGGALFVERARESNPNFKPDPTDLQNIEHLVGMLDGLPLAIELAAARMRLYTPERLLDRLSQRFRLLASRAPDRPERQRTLFATLQWSWELLHPEEQQVLAQCSVFEGGFTLSAAEDVLEVDEDVWLDEVLGELIDKSLLSSRNVDVHANEPRLRMLVSVQEFAREKLGDARSLEVRHGEHYAQLGAPGLLSQLSRAGSREKRQRMALERANLTAATRRAIARRDPAIASRCALAVAEVIRHQGPYGEGIALLRAVLPLLTAGSPEHLDGLLMLGDLESSAGQHEAGLETFETALALATAAGDIARQVQAMSEAGFQQYQLGASEAGYARLLETEALARSRGVLRQLPRVLLYLYSAETRLASGNKALGRLEECVRLSRANGDRLLESRAQSSLSGFASVEGDHLQAEMLMRDALRTLRELGARRWECHVLGRQGFNLYRMGRYGDALRVFGQALQMARSLGERNWQGLWLGNIGSMHLTRGELAPALEAFEEALQISHEIDDLNNQPMWLFNIGIVYLSQDRFDEAQQRYEQALEIAYQIQNFSMASTILINLGHLLYERGAHAEAKSIFLEALEYAERFDNRLNIGILLGSLGDVALETGQYDEARERLIASEAILRPLGEQNYLAQILCKRAVLETTTGHTALAAALLGEVRAINMALGLGPDSMLGRAIKAAETRIAQLNAEPQTPS